MNKILEIKSLLGLWKIQEFSNSINPEFLMLDIFGLKIDRENHYNYIIQDESKCNLFILKYPEHIERIFHE